MTHPNTVRTWRPVGSAVRPREARLARPVEFRATPADVHSPPVKRQGTTDLTLRERENEDESMAMPIPVTGSIDSGDPTSMSGWTAKVRAPSRPSRTVRPACDAGVQA